MFKTIVIACHIGNMSICLSFEDLRGPYDTHQQCRSRAYEMSNAIKEIHGEELKPLSFQCEQLTGTKL
jgi:hypothetical protein